MPYGNRIRVLREKAKMSQSDLGVQLGVSSQAVSKWELDKSEPDSEAIRKLCSIFSVSANELIGINSKANTQTSDDDIKFALFGDASNITDAQFEEVKRYAQYIKGRGVIDK